jgi:hypothetical protein
MQFKRIETLSTFRNMKGREMRELKEPVLITSQPPGGIAEPLVVLLPYTLYLEIQRQFAIARGN